MLAKLNVKRQTELAARTARRLSTAYPKWEMSRARRGSYDGGRAATLRPQWGFFMNAVGRRIGVRAALGLALCLGVSACGGGGGGDNGGGNDPPALTSGTPVNGLAAGTGHQAMYQIVVPAGASSLVAATTGGTGDLDLYLRQGQTPTTASFDCASAGATTEETCTVETPAAGTWYVMLNAYAAYSGVTLTVTVTAPSGGGGTTPGGFALLKDINASGSSEPANFVPVGANTFFIADDGTNGRELWVTDGTPSGSRVVKDVYSGAASGVSYIASVSVLGDKLMFVGSDGSASGALWISDGTAAGTQLVKDVATSTSENIIFLGQAGSRMYFSADDGVHGRELWASDGTAAGTHMVADLTAGGADSDSNFTDGLAWNGSFYFYAEPNIYPYYADLYVTDGTAGNVQKLTPAGTHSSYLQDLIVYQNRLYFTWASAGEGEELWMTNGTPGGTQLFKALLPATASSVGNAYPELFHIVNNMLLFFAYDGTSGSDKSLWASNGTAAGTQVIATVGQGPNLDEMVLMNGRYYFPGRFRGVSSFTLWSTDGTAGGTYEVSSAVRPDDWYGSMKMVSIGNRLVFQGTDGTHGYEPWVSDGTAAGTQMLADTYPGSSSSYRTGLVMGGWITARGSKAYFVARRADDDFHFFETDGTPAGTQVIAPSTATVTTNPMGIPAFTGTTGVPAPVLNGSTLFIRGGYTAAGHELYKF